MNRHALLLIGILLLAALLRFFDLAGESFWLDEGVALKLSSLPVERLADNRTQGPLFLLLTKIMHSLFGTSESVLRILPAIFGVACVYAGYRLGQLLFDARVGLLAALLMAVNPFLVHCSQDGRPYTLFLLGAMGSLYHAVQLARRTSWRDVAGYAFWTAVAVHSQPFSVFLFPAHVVAFLLVRSACAPGVRVQRTRTAILAAVVALLVCAPQIYLYGSMFFLKVSGGPVATWIPRATWQQLPNTLARFFSWQVLAVVMAVIGLAGFVRRRPNREEWIALSVLASVCVFLVLLPWAISLKTAPIYQARYAIPALAALLIAVAWAITVFPQTARIGVTALILILTAVPLHAYYTKVDKDPWRQTAERLAVVVRPGDTVIQYPDWTEWPLAFYFQPPSSVRVLPIKQDDDVRSLIHDADRVWTVTSYGGDGKFPDDALHRMLADTHIADSVMVVNDDIVCNPYAGHIIEIRLTRFVRQKP